MKYLVFMLAAFMLFTACSDEEDNNTTEIIIGGLLPANGSGKSTGEGAANAMTLAIDDINAMLESEGSDIRFAYEIFDTHTDPDVALSKLGDFNGMNVNFVVGPYSSSSCAKCVDYADNNEYMLVSPSSVSSDLAIADDNLFRLVPTDDKNAEATVALLKDDGIEYIYGLVRDDVWGNSAYDDLKTEFEKYPNSLSMAKHTYDPNETDFSLLINSLNNSIDENLEKKKMAVLIFSFEEGTHILEKLSAANFLYGEMKFYGSSAFANNASILVSPEAMQFAKNHGGFKCPIFGYDESDELQAQAIMTRIEALIGRTPDIYALCAYDATMLAYETYKANNFSMDPRFSEFKQLFVDQANSYTGVTGSTKLNEFGDRESGDFFNWGIGDDGKWKVYSVYDSESKTIEKK